MRDLQSQTPRRIDAVILVIVTAAVFAVVMKTPFAYLDDQAMLVTNPRYLNASFRNILDHFTDPQFNIFAPLTYSVWHIIAMLTVHKIPSEHIAEMYPYGFKIASILTHIGSALAVWWVLGKLVHHRWGVLIGAILFAVHPMMVEPVTWTTGLKDELCGLFCFLSIGCYLRYLGSGVTKHWYITMVFVICAALSKPTAVVLPVGLLAVDFYYRRVSLEKRLYSVSLFLLPTIASSVIMVYIQDGWGITSPLWARPLIALDALSYYIYKVAIPYRILPDYGRSPLNIIYNGQIFWTWILSVAVIAAVLRFGSNRIRLALALFIIPLLPILGLTKFDMQQYTTVTDHYIYQSMAAVGLFAAILIENYQKVIPAFVVIILVLSAKTIHQITIWEDQNVLMNYNLQYHPGSLFCLRGASNYYLGQKQYKIAEEYARRAIDAKKRFGDYRNLVRTLILQDRYNEANYYARQAANSQSGDLRGVKSLLKEVAVLRDPDLDEQLLRLWHEMEPKNIELQLQYEQLRRFNQQRSTSQPTTAP